MAIYIRRRELIAALGGSAVAWPLAGPAQQRARPARIGYLSSNSPPDVNPTMALGLEIAASRPDPTRR
jgi:hypothetical protein